MEVNMPGPNNNLGGPIIDNPIFLAGCRFTKDTTGKDPVTMECNYNRELLGNKELTKNLTCERKIETRFVKGKAILEISVICSPKVEQVIRDVRLWKLGKPA